MSLKTTTCIAYISISLKQACDSHRLHKPQIMVFISAISHTTWQVTLFFHNFTYQLLNRQLNFHPDAFRWRHALAVHRTLPSVIYSDTVADWLERLQLPCTRRTRDRDFESSASAVMYRSLAHVLPRLMVGHCRVATNQYLVLAARKGGPNQFFIRFTNKFSSILKIFLGTFLVIKALRFTDDQC